MPRAGDPVIYKADLVGIRDRIKEDAIQSEVTNIASDVLDAANALKTSMTYDVGPPGTLGKWHTYYHDQYTKQITWHYTPATDEVLPRLREKFPDCKITCAETDGRFTITIDWS